MDATPRWSAAKDEHELPASVNAPVSPVSLVSSTTDVHHLAPKGVRRAARHTGAVQRAVASTMVAPDMTSQAAEKQIAELTAAEHQRISAFLKYGTFKKAAEALHCDQETVSSTWHRYRGLIKALVDERKPAPHQ